jgi:predicted nucleic acid-binding protein
VIILDASVLIAHLDAGDAQHERAVQRLLEVADQPLGCSSITRAEVLAGPARHGRTDIAEAALGTLALEDVALAGNAPARLAELRVTTGLKLPDCCVVLAAQDADADLILSFNERLSRAAARLGFGASGPPFD